MEIEQLHEKFTQIINKYSFKDEMKARRLADFIASKEKHSSQELADEFSIEVEEAKILLNFFQKGIEFKKKSDDLI
mgnify:CR=1